MTVPGAPASSAGVGTLEREAPGLVLPAPGTRSRSGARRRRTLIAVAAGLLILLIGMVALTTGSSSGGSLDPRSAAPGGTRALAALLRERGIEVTRGVQARMQTTVLVPFPEALTESDLSALLSSGADVVLVDPGSVDTAQVTAGPELRIRARAPGCGLPIAQVAGSVRIGGTQYTSANTATSCYDGALLELPAGTVNGGGRVTILGSSDFLTNAHLASDGNAALAIGLLSRQPALTWFTARRTTEGKSVTDLLPKAIPWALLQIGIALVVVGFWRGRRLGPVVTEPLPVVVRAAETVLGRARLYASARARDTAAEAIRTGSRARLAALLHVDPSFSAAELISAVAARTGAEPGVISGLLYAGGGYRAGESDASLVRLAADLDQLEERVKRPSGGPPRD